MPYCRVCLDLVKSPMKPVDRATRSMWRSLNWRDPRTDLVELGKLHGRLVKEGHQPEVDHLRNHELQQYLEQRQAALFAHFVSEAILKAPIAYAMKETEDYDCVLWWKIEKHSFYTPVQLKEIVPHHLNPKTSINSELFKLSKYATASKTIAAFHVNQSGHLDFSSIDVPKTGLSEVWLYGSLSADQAKWFLYGNILDSPKGYEVAWPT
jgi:hypothetical protein